MTGLLRTQLAKLGMVRQLSVPFPFPAVAVLGGGGLDRVKAHLSHVNVGRVGLARRARSGGSRAARSPAAGLATLSAHITILWYAWTGAAVVQHQRA